MSRGVHRRRGKVARMLSRDAAPTTAFGAPHELRQLASTVAVYPDDVFTFERLCQLHGLDPRLVCNMAHPAHRALVEYRIALGESITIVERSAMEFIPPCGRG